MRIEGLLRAAVADNGAGTAIIAGKSRCSLADIDIRSDRMAAALRGRGVGRGDHVIVFMDDGWETIVSLFGVLKAGAVFSPVRASATTAELASVVRARPAVGIVTESRLATIAATVLSHAPSVRLIVLVGGDRTTATDTCLSFEETVHRLGSTPQLAEAGGETDPAAVFADGTALNHREVIASVEATAGLGGGSATTHLPSIAGEDGLVRMLAAISRGVAVMLRQPVARVGSSLRGVAPRRSTGYFDQALIFADSPAAG